MKAKILKSLVLSVISSMVLASVPVERKVPVVNIYSPEGFDSNDNVEVIVEGYLPNLCHKAPFSKVSVEGNKVNIEVSSLHYHESNPYCPEMVVPFIEAVDLGVLDKGKYDIVVNGKSIFEMKSDIAIAESSSDAVDEVVYANVDYVERVQGERKVMLKGYNPSDCFVMDKVEFVDNKRDAYSVLPKMKQVSDFCPMKMVPFEWEVEVPNKIKRDKVLLHVRVLNGKSVNKLFNNLER